MAPCALFRVGCLAGCLAATLALAAEPEEAPKTRSIDEILAADEAASADYGEPVNCLSRWQYEHTEIINERYVVFKGRSGHIWVNELRRACTGLSRSDILQFSGTTSRVCELDSFDVLDRFGFIGPTQSCTLGKFHPVTEVQLDVIRQSLQSKR